MFNSTQIELFFKAALLHSYLFVGNNIYCFNDDLKDVENLYHRTWTPNSVSYNGEENLVVKVAFPGKNSRKKEASLQLLILKIAADELGMGTNVTKYKNVRQLFQSVKSTESDLCLMEVFPGASYDTLLPFIATDFAIYYKIDEFHVSSTYFIDGMSSELWIYTFIALSGIFIGFLITTKLLCHYLKRSWFIGDVFIYQANFWCNQGLKYYLDNFLSWRIQMINGFIFNVIMMTAFSAKFTSLMSVWHFDQPFKSLEDFATLRTHIICNPEDQIPTLRHFGSPKSTAISIKIDRKWNGIFNEPQCKDVFINFQKQLCISKNIAVVKKKNEFIDRLSNCSVMELNGFFPKKLGSILFTNVSRDLKKCINVTLL